MASLMDGPRYHSRWRQRRTCSFYRWDIAWEGSPSLSRRSNNHSGTNSPGFNFVGVLQRFGQGTCNEYHVACSPDRRLGNQDPVEVRLVADDTRAGASLAASNGTWRGARIRLRKLKLPGAAGGVAQLFGSMGDPKRSVLEERPSRIVRG